MRGGETNNALFYNNLLHISSRLEQTTVVKSYLNNGLLGFEPRIISKQLVSLTVVISSTLPNISPSSFANYGNLHTYNYELPNNRCETIIVCVSQPLLFVFSIVVWDVFERLRPNLDDLKDLKGSLVGVSGEQVQVKGYIPLKTTFGA